MLLVKRAWRVVSPGFFGPSNESIARSVHAEQSDADAEAARLNGADGALNWYRVEPCFVLEVPQEKGPSLFFDLGQPVAVR